MTGFLTCRRNLAPSSPGSRPRPPDGLRPALTPAAGDADSQRTGADRTTEIRQFQVSLVRGDLPVTPP
jgi:hypothetical protein